MDTDTVNPFDSALDFVDEATYLRQCVSVNAGDVQGDMRRVSSDYGYWNERYATAYATALRARVEREQVCAQRRIEIRATADATGRKVTEGTLDAEVNTDIEVANARAAEIAADAEHARLRGVLEAIRTKREMLISLGAYQRQEFAAASGGM